MTSHTTAAPNLLYFNCIELTFIPLMEIVDEHPVAVNKPSDETWLNMWCKIQAISPKDPHVPSTAQVIHMLLVHSGWPAALDGYFYQPIVKFFL